MSINSLIYLLLFVFESLDVVHQAGAEEHLLGADSTLADERLQRDPDEELYAFGPP